MNNKLNIDQSEIRYKDLSKEDKVILNANSVTNTAFNHRMKMGWELYDAINLPSSFRSVDGEIKRSINVNGEIYHIYPYHYFKMQFYKLSSYDIIKRIDNGATIEQATSVINGASKYDIAPVVEQEKDNKINYAQLLFEQSCKQFLEAK